jgi:hypothetical protein
MAKSMITLATVAVLLVSASALAAPDKNDLTTAINGPGGCELIPFPQTQKTCKNANAQIHGRTSCDVGACTTRAQKPAWKKCVTARTASNNAFQSAINQLTNLKKTAWKGTQPANQEMRELADQVIELIKVGQPGHEEALDAAKRQLRNCP